MSRTIVIGGGAIGLSVAYHLAARSLDDVLLLERNTLTSGTSWHAAGIVGPLRATPGMTQLASHALDLFPRLEDETGMSTGYRRTGGYWIARERDRMDELHRIADLGQTQGLTPQVIDASQIPVPQVESSLICGALFVPEDANVNPVDLCMAYARAASNHGAEIREGVTVARILVDKARVQGVELTDGNRIGADNVVICTGAWSCDLGATAGLHLPLQPVQHMYVVTEPVPDLPDPFPVLRDLDRGTYIKGDAGRLVIGGFEPDAICWDPNGPEGDRAFLELAEDWDQFMPFMESTLDLMPALADVGIQRFMNGPESFTNDTRPLVGAAPGTDGLFVAAGMNSVGIMSSAGVGKVLADWVIDGHPGDDLWEVDVARADPLAAAPAHMKSRMEEAVADLLRLHWPYKQPTKGRGLRTSALHKCWAEMGAHFGQTAGWERGLWFQDPPAEALPYSVSDQHWWPTARAEAAVMEAGTVMLDLSPFTKIEVSGAGVAEALELVFTSCIASMGERAIYTHALNDSGGIEMDVTLTRLGHDQFRIISGAATRWRDLGFLRRALPGFAITDRTEDFAVIGVMGAGSAEMLSKLNRSAIWANAGLGTVMDVRIADTPCRATRISFVGEYGWEVEIPSDAAEQVFNALRAEGVRPMGHYALDGCRIEKGFRHWGHDIGPTITPLEAGLAFTINWTKPFRGRDALLQQRQEGVNQRLVLLRVNGGPLLLHDEPVYFGGECIGFTTSGARGPRTGLDLAFALLKVPQKTVLLAICDWDLTVRVAGKNYPARALPKPPFDPAGRRMRG